MQKVSLVEVSAELMMAARASSAGRSGKTIHGGPDHALRQTLLALVEGAALGEHESPGEANLYVISGQVRLRAGDEAIEARAGDFLEIPPARHDLAALEDSVVLLSVVSKARG
jgi:quercetin dioxygenase-like cupin family protein